MVDKSNTPITLGGFMVGTFVFIISGSFFAGGSATGAASAGAGTGTTSSFSGGLAIEAAFSAAL